MRQPLRTVVRMGASLAWALLMSGCSGQGASGPIHLRYASPYPPNHPFSQADIAWIKKIETDSKGRLKIDAYWGGTTISSDETVFELKHGVADIALITPIYQRAGVQAIKTQTGFYIGADTPREQIAAYHCLQAAFPVLTKELAGVRVLAVQGGSLSRIVTRDRPVRSLDDLRGLRLRAPVEAAPALRQLGANPVTMPMGEVYSAMSKGAIDGVVAPWDTLKTLHFSEVAHDVNNLAFARGAYPARAISDQAYHSLPPDLRSLLDQSGSFWEASLSTYINKAEQAGAAFGHAQGMVFLDPPTQDQRRFQAIEEAVAIKDAGKLDSEGIPGLAMFRFTQRVIGRIRNGQPGCP